MSTLPTNTPLELLDLLRVQAVSRLQQQTAAYTIQISVGMATCGVSAGAEAVWQALQDEISRSGRGDISLERIGCIGQCHAEPLVEISPRGKTPVLYGGITADIARDLFRGLLQGQPPQEKFLVDGSHRYRLFLLGDGVDRAAYRQHLAELSTALTQAGVADDTQLFEAACLQPPFQGTLLMLAPGDVAYLLRAPGDAARIVQALFEGNPIPELIAPAEVLPPFLHTYNVPTVTERQLRIASRNCGIIDPQSLDQALVAGEYLALAKALGGQTPEEVLQTVYDSGLRGRGGGGYRTGQKWRDARSVPGAQKYLICNADEGDPGAFMDRNMLEGDPHAILEGMALAGYAIGASEGFIYIRTEYPQAVGHLQQAIGQAEAVGLLGTNILGSPFSFNIAIRLGAGAFVCGEETALLHSIEGGRGMPSPRPPFPSTRGLWDCPTVINNVETLADVAPIVQHGAAWYAQVGTEKSKGTKVFALAGKVQRTGLVEVPMGITLRETIFTLGGGIRGGRAFKAVQIGGPSGGCLPESLLDTIVDYDSLVQAGVIMGSGGMIVLDEDDCMVDVARFFLEFTQDESCGKCTPCREGTKRMLEILTRITGGEGTMKDLDLLQRLGHTIQRASLCGLGQTAPNPALSTLRHFYDEYLEHIRDGYCRAGVCHALVRYQILPNKCIGCGACRRACPVGCITGEPRQPHLIDQSKCIKCGACYRACRFTAVKH